MEHSQTENTIDTDTDTDASSPFLPTSPSPYQHEKHPYGHDAPSALPSRIQTILTKVITITYIPLLLAVIYLTHRITSTPTATQHACQIPALLPSPAQESGAIVYTTRKLDVTIYDNPFSGAPDTASDSAWHDLLEHTTIKATASELQAANLTSLELADGSGFVAVPAVGHQLHCLKRIRHWVYRDHYHGDDTRAQAEENAAHVDHCIEMLRQLVLCHGDMSLSTFSYMGDTMAPTAVDHADHQCVDWPLLRQWMVGRSVSLTTPGVLKPPG